MNLMSGISALAVCWGTAALAAAPDLFIGTQDRGNTTPAATYPFGLVQPGPDTSEKPDVLSLNPFHASGYQYGDRFIWRFSQLHFSGTGGPGLGNIGIMPFGGEWTGFPALPLVKETERAEPGYYAVGEAFKEYKPTVLSDEVGLPCTSTKKVLPCGIAVRVQF